MRLVPPTGKIARVANERLAAARNAYQQGSSAALLPPGAIVGVNPYGAIAERPDLTLARFWAYTRQRS